LPMHVFGHAGIGILHVLILAAPDERDAAEAARGRLVDRVLALGGACSGEHGMGTGNRRFAAREHGPALALMQGVKAVFDPQGILNPGKIW
jgi:D-lactate dehydrogenase (cytochrome)